MELEAGGPSASSSGWPDLEAGGALNIKMFSEVYKGNTRERRALFFSRVRIFNFTDAASAFLLRSPCIIYNRGRRNKCISKVPTVISRSPYG